jgi:dCTP diphosphatase
LEDLRTAIGAFIAERDWEQFHSPKNLAMALSVEAAEIVEHFQWLTERQSRNLPPEKLAEVREEIGDVMIYLTELADKLGIDPIEAARAKLEINRQKYPADLVKGKANGDYPLTARTSWRWFVGFYLGSPLFQFDMLRDRVDVSCQHRFPSTAHPPHVHAQSAYRRLVG